MRPLDVGIIGAGTAGTAAAIFLARAGHRITLYERVPHPGPVGAGITIQPTGQHVLARLGIHSYIASRGARVDSLQCETPTGRAVIDLSYKTIGEHLFGLGLHRGVLFEALHDAASREPITTRRGIEIIDLARTESGGRWNWFVDNHGERHGPHELVIVCDGARSQLRDDTGTSKRIAQYPWGALWFVGREPRAPDHPHARMLRQVCDGNQRFLGILPTGHGPGPEIGPRLVSLFWSIRCDRVDAWRERGLRLWVEELVKLAPESAPVLDQINDESQVLFATYHDVVMHRWSTRSVVYLGDAAHATSPQLGQGCNLALWDAMTLAETLAAEEHDLACALDRYSRTRTDHLAFYQLATRLLTPFFQGDNRAYGVLRDVVMPLMSKVPLSRRIMTLSMLGVIDGFTGRTLALDLPADG